MFKTAIVLAVCLSVAHAAAINDATPAKVNPDEQPKTAPVDAELPAKGREGRAEVFQLDPAAASPYNFQTAYPGGPNTMMQGSSYNFPPPPPPEVVQKAMEALMSDKPLVDNKHTRPASKHYMEPILFDMGLHKKEVASGIVGTVATVIVFSLLLGLLSKLALAGPLLVLKSLLFKKKVTSAVSPALGVGLPGILPAPVPVTVPIPVPVPVPGGAVVPANGNNGELAVLVPENPAGVGIVANDQNERDDGENEAEAQARSSYTEMLFPVLQQVFRSIEKYAEMNEKEE